MSVCRCGHHAGSHDRLTGYCRAQRARREPCGCKQYGEIDGVTVEDFEKAVGRALYPERHGKVWPAPRTALKEIENMGLQLRGTKLHFDALRTRVARILHDVDTGQLSRLETIAFELRDALRDTEGR